MNTSIYINENKKQIEKKYKSKFNNRHSLKSNRALKHLKQHDLHKRPRANLSYL